MTPQCIHTTLCVCVCVCPNPLMSITTPSSLMVGNTRGPQNHMGWLQPGWGRRRGGGGLLLILPHPPIASSSLSAASGMARPGSPDRRCDRPAAAEADDGQADCHVQRLTYLSTACVRAAVTVRCSSRVPFASLGHMRQALQGLVGTIRPFPPTPGG